MKWFLILTDVQYAQFHFWIACGILLVCQDLFIVLVFLVLLHCSVLGVLSSGCKWRMQHLRVLPFFVEWRNVMFQSTEM